MDPNVVNNYFFILNDYLLSLTGKLQRREFYDIMGVFQIPIFMFNITNIGLITIYIYIILFLKNHIYCLVCNQFACKFIFVQAFVNLFKELNQALEMITYDFNNTSYLNSQRAIG